MERAALGVVSRFVGVWRRVRSRDAKAQSGHHRPFQVGIAVYQMAKFRVLQYYYNCLDKFLDRGDFELIQMDTESLHFALLCDSLKEAVHLELREEFQKWKKKNDLLGPNGLNANPGCLSSSLRALARFPCPASVITERTKKAR